MGPVQRIVLLGKTGAGKSASANTILGSTKFKAELSASSVTQNCQEEKKEFGKNTLAIVDTPGLFHTSITPEKLMAEILETILKIHPGPHVFLLVLRLGPFSKADKKVLETFQKVFTDAKCHTIVLFTHGDECEVDEFIKSNSSLDDFINQSSVDYHVFNNEVMDDDSQVTGLLQKINKVVEANEGKCYSNTTFDVAKEVVDVLMQRPEPAQQSLEPVKEWIEKNVSKIDPGVYKMVKGFLDKVKEVAYELMPDECKN